MDGGGAGGVLASRLAWAFPVGFLLLTLLTRFSNAVYWSGLAGGVVLAGLFVLPLLRAVPRGRALWVRRGGWLLAVQAVATYAPLAVFGQDWINIAPGLLAGLLPLTVSAPASWVMFGAVLAVEVARIAILGLPPAANAAIVTWMLVAPVTTGLAFFGLVRLGDLATSLHAARTELADLSVLRERRWSAERLRAAIGDHLVVVAARARTALGAVLKAT